MGFKMLLHLITNVGSQIMEIDDMLSVDIDLPDDVENINSNKIIWGVIGTILITAVLAFLAKVFCIRADYDKMEKSIEKIKEIKNLTKSNLNFINKETKHFFKKNKEISQLRVVIDSERIDVKNEEVIEMLVPKKKYFSLNILLNKIMEKNDDYTVRNDYQNRSNQAITQGRQIAT